MAASRAVRLLLSSSSSTALTQAISKQSSAAALTWTARTSRTFTTSAPVQKDIITDMYIKEIRNYKAPPEDKMAATDITETVSIPQPPPMPEFEMTEVQAVSDEAALEEEAWPALMDPIDDPENYNTDWDFTTDKVDDRLIPTRLKEAHYDNHH